MTPGAAAAYLPILVAQRVESVKTATRASMPRCANQLRNAELDVLNNESPSAPGNPPGVRTGDLRRNWIILYGDNTFGIQSEMNYAGYLEHGTSKMAARPFVDKIQESALPRIRTILESIGG